MASPYQITTWLDLFKLTLKTAGILGVGQSASAEDINDTAQYASAMIGQYQKRRYLVYHIQEQSIACTGAQSYSVGPGGDFSMASRPSIINYAFARQVINANPNQIDYPIFILPARETYAQVAMKQLQSFPQWAFYDADFPLANLFVYPVITSQFSLYIGWPALLQTIGALTDTIILPPEYQEGLLYPLAKRLRVAWQLPPDEELNGLAKAALETMRTANAQIPQMRMPNILREGARYNIFSDRAGPANY